jgi:hypothetical protein
MDIKSQNYHENILNPLLDNILEKRICRTAPKGRIGVSVEKIEGTKEVNSRVRIIKISQSGEIIDAFVLKIFGEAFNLTREILEDIKKHIILYQHQLRNLGIITSYSIECPLPYIQTLDGRLGIVMEEIFFGETENHLMQISDPIISPEIKLNTILRDLNVILSIRDKTKIDLFGKTFTKLKTGIDAIPKNFIARNKSILVDITPPLDIIGDTLYWNTNIAHPLSPISYEGWFYFVGTLEGAILRYLNSSEYNLKEKAEIIHSQYEKILSFLKMQLATASFKYVQDQILNKDYSDINDIYKRHF